MASDIFSLGLGVDPSGALVGVQQFKGALADAAQAAQSSGEKAGTNFGQGFSAKAQGMAAIAAKSSVEAFQTQFAADQARISEGLARGFITPQQAKQAGIEAAQNYNQGLLLTLDKLGQAGFNVSNSQQYQELATSLKSVETASSTAFAGVGRIRQGLVSLAAQATGTIPVLDRVGSSLLTMGAGGGVALAVIAGVAAVALAYEGLTKYAREAQEQQDKLTQSLREWYQTQELGEAGQRQQQVAAATREITQLQQKIADLRVQQNAPSFSAGKGADTATQANLQAQIDAITVKIQQDRDEINAANQDVVKRQSEAFIELQGQEASRLATLIQNNQATAAERARAIALLKQDQTLIAQYTKAPSGADAATVALLQGLRADLSEQITTLQSALNGAKTLDRSGFAGTPTDSDTKALVDGLSKQYDELVKVNEQNNLDNLNTEKKIALNGVLGGQRQIIEAYYDAQLERLKALHDLSGPALTERLAQIAADEHAAVAVGAVNKAKDEQTQLTATGIELGKISLAQVAANIELTKKQTTETANQIKANEQFARTMTGDVLQAFDQLARHGTLSFESIAQAVESLTARLAKLPKLSDDALAHIKDVNIAIAGASAGFAFGQQAGSDANGVIGGGVQGAAFGFATGGPVGAVIGGISGAVGGLLGAADAHKQAAKALQDAAKAFQQNAVAYISGAGGQNSVSQQLAANDKQLSDLTAQLLALLIQAGKQGKNAFLSTVANNPNEAALQAGHDQNQLNIAKQFFDGITQAINAMGGPAGALTNQLTSIANKRNDDLASLNALYKAGAVTLPQLIAGQRQLNVLYDAQAQSAKLAAAEQQRETFASISLATESANAHTLAQQQQLQRDQLAEQERAEMQKAMDQRAIDAMLGLSTTSDDMTIALLNEKDAAEQAALAVNQLAQSIDAVSNAVSTSNDIMGVTGSQAIQNLASGFNQNNPTGQNVPRFDLSPFKLDTVAGDEAAISYLQGIYQSLDPTNPSYSVYVGEIKNLVDQIRSLEQQNGGTGAALGGGSANLSAKASSVGVDIGSVTQIDASQATNLIGLGTTANMYLSVLPLIEQHTRRLELSLGATPGAAGAGVGSVVYLTVTLGGADAEAFIAMLRSNPRVGSAFDQASGRNFIRSGASAGLPRV